MHDGDIHDPCWPSQPRLGGWIQTASGLQVWPFDARPEEIRATDIAHALSHLCRFTGTTREFLSVAQHSLLIADIVREVGGDREAQLQGLLHDASEAYLGDVTNPVKRFLRACQGNYPSAYDVAEARLTAAIFRRFGVPLPLPELVHVADRVALATECRDFVGALLPDWDREQIPEPYHVYRVSMVPVLARRLWLARFAQLGGVL